MSDFTTCPGCRDIMCPEIKQCIAELHKEAYDEQQKYIAAGVCSDCGACSLAEARDKCRPRALGDTGDVTCAGELLWEGQEP